MFGLFKKSIEKEFYKRMRQSKKSYDFIQKNNPFEVAPTKYNKHSEILAENRKWLAENIEELKKIITDEQYEMILALLRG